MDNKITVMMKILLFVIKLMDSFDFIYIYISGFLKASQLTTGV